MKYIANWNIMTASINIFIIAQPYFCGLSEPCKKVEDKEMNGYIESVIKFRRQYVILRPTQSNG
jgi:hypothetical protein